MVEADRFDPWSAVAEHRPLGRSCARARPRTSRATGTEREVTPRTRQSTLTLAAFRPWGVGHDAAARGSLPEYAHRHTRTIVGGGFA